MSTYRNYDEEFRRNCSQILGDVIVEYKATRGSEWSEGYLLTFRWATLAGTGSFGWSCLVGDELGLEIGYVRVVCLQLETSVASTILRLVEKHKRLTVRCSSR